MNNKQINNKTRHLSFSKIETIPPHENQLSQMQNL